MPGNMAKPEYVERSFPVKDQTQRQVQGDPGRMQVIGSLDPDRQIPAFERNETGKTGDWQSDFADTQE